MPEQADNDHYQYTLYEEVEDRDTGQMTSFKVQSAPYNASGFATLESLARSKRSAYIIIERKS